MGTCVYVSPWEMIRAICMDIGAPESSQPPFSIVEGPPAETDARGRGGGMTVTIRLDFLSEISTSGSIKLTATSDRHTAEVIRSHTALQSLMRSLEGLYGIRPTDFSQVMLSEKRALYDGTNQALDDLLCTLGFIERAVGESCSAMQNMCTKLCSWVYINRHRLLVEERMAIEGFWACMNYFNADMSVKVEEINKDLRSLKFKAFEPMFHGWFSEDTLMPMEVNWERSYYLLKSIFDEASTKLGCDDYGLHVYRTSYGSFRGVIDTDHPVHHFEGDAAPSKLAAKAKVMFAGIKYMKEGLHYRILDANHELLHHGEKFMNDFGVKLAALQQSADQLQNIIGECGTILEINTSEVVKQLGISCFTSPAVSIIQDGASEFQDAKTSFDESWSRFMSQMESRKRRYIVGSQALD